MTIIFLTNPSHMKAVFEFLNETGYVMKVITIDNDTCQIKIMDDCQGELFEINQNSWVRTGYDKLNEKLERL